MFYECCKSEGQHTDLCEKRPYYYECCGRRRIHRSVCVNNPNYLDCCGDTKHKSHCTKNNIISKINRKCMLISTVSLAVMLSTTIYLFMNNSYYMYDNHHMLDSFM